MINLNANMVNMNKKSLFIYWLEKQTFFIEIYDKLRIKNLNTLYSVANNQKQTATVILN